MRPEEIRNHLRRQPFVRLRIHLTDGSSYEIRHPEMAFLSRSALEVGLEEREGNGIADQVIYCALLHIVRVELVDGQTSMTA